MDILSNSNIVRTTLKVAKVLIDVEIFILRTFIYFAIEIFDFIFPSQPSSVRGQIVVIADGANAIGKELAFLYSEQRATVVLLGNNNKVDYMKQTVSHICERGHPRPHYFTCDITNYNDVKKTALLIQNTIGKVSILILNMDYFMSLPMLHQNTEEVKHVIDSNLTSAFWLLYGYMESMFFNKRGHIVAITETTILEERSQKSICYQASKLGFSGAMKALQTELSMNSDSSISVTVVHSYSTRITSNRQNIRFNSFVPAFDPKRIAEVTIHAQRRRISEVTTPKFMVFASAIARCFPQQIINNITNFLQTAST